MRASRFFSGRVSSGTGPIGVPALVTRHGPNIVAKLVLSTQQFVARGAECGLADSVVRADGPPSSEFGKLALVEVYAHFPASLYAARACAARSGASLTKITDSVTSV